MEWTGPPSSSRRQSSYHSYRERRTLATLTVSPSDGDHCIASPLKRNLIPPLFYANLVYVWEANCHNGLCNTHTHTARSDRYTHEFVSDDEEGDDEAFQQPFENFSSTAPRFSHLLNTSFDENDPKKEVLQLKHEKRDSGISGIEEHLKIDETIKILGEHKPEMLSPSDHEASGDSSLHGEGEGEGEDEENVVTKIDEVSSHILKVHAAESESEHGGLLSSWLVMFHFSVCRWLQGRRRRRRRNKEGTVTRQCRLPLREGPRRRTSPSHLHSPLLPPPPLSHHHW